MRPEISTADPAFSGAATPIKARPFIAQDTQAWDAFVRGHGLGTPFHLIAWRDTITEAFGYRPYYFVAESEGKIRGILPLFLVQNLLIGRVLISTPFAVYGGALTDSLAAREALRGAVEELGRTLKAGYIELRNASLDQALGFTPVDAYVTFRQPIGPDEKQILEAIPRKTRYMVRKALNNGFSTRTAEQPTAGFLDLYSKNLRRLGTPSFPERYFRALLRNFRGYADVREVLQGDRVASAVLSLYFRDQVLPYYGASDQSMNALAPNYFMYFDLMRDMGKEGFRVYDFGRSKKHGSTSYDFKSHWGMEERNLPYEILLVNRKQMPNFRPNNRAFRWPLAIWRRLPLPLTRWIGPWFVKLVP